MSRKESPQLCAQMRGDDIMRGVCLEGRVRQKPDGWGLADEGGISGRQSETKTRRQEKHQRPQGTRSNTDTVPL